ncbi:hypothetical protein AAFF_G00316350 [Aldrovandia affinis]|uniref:ribonuclease H n=1 Tax=Aldrovandia affinis TaxID=143900 RepID=A0AAD7SNE6_9TELE|nr:hypothetical protein AAFF_G00316350 [Aldrovandia affinis]
MGSPRSPCLNAVTRKDAYPLPRINDALDHISGSRWFSSLDLRNGYWQVELAPDAWPKTAFTIGQGLWQFRVMPFGLCNAPATFERLMEWVLSHVPKQHCIVYLDNLLVHAGDLKGALHHLWEVFATIRQAGLRLNPKKWQLFRRETAFLGHVVSADGVATNPVKIAAVRNWPPPTNISNLRSFLGLASYYRRYVQDFAIIARPLHRLTDRGQPYVWDDPCAQAFNVLQTCTAQKGPIRRFVSMKFKSVTFIDSSFQNCYFDDVTSVGSYFRNCTFIEAFFYNTDIDDSKLIDTEVINSTFHHNKTGCQMTFDDDYSAYWVYFVNFLGTLAVLPGNIVSALLMDKIGRLSMLGGSMILSGISCFFLWFGTSESMMIGMLCLYNGLSISAWNSLDVVTVELYPTDRRGTGFGFCNALCKLAAVLGNMIFGSLVGITKAIPILLASTVLVCGGLVGLRLPDTRANVLM